ncbi:gliding motility-associated C-terminal domain-containing protein [Maribacter sp. X9]|uniref:T9SS type B sorting domain-containing protein n=1 Tax=Maribacter sp. X9 TaxID=3402159 RepID=UPI003AF3D614
MTFQNFFFLSKEKVQFPILFTFVFFVGLVNANSTKIDSNPAKTRNSTFISPTITLDPTNSTGAGGTDINTEACSSGWEILDNTNTGVSANFNSPDGTIMSMSISLINPQDGLDEQLGIGGTFSGVLVEGNGTQNLTITNTGTAGTGTMQGVLDDLIYRDLAADPNTTVQRQVSIQITDELGQLSNTANAYFNVTKAANAGKTNGPLIVFSSDTTIDLFTALDGNQDNGGTWVDIDGSGALTGNIVDISSIPLGGTSFRYEVSAPLPCGTATVTVLVIKINSDQVPINSSASCGALMTNYTDPLYSGNSNDPIYIFNLGGDNGVLEAEVGVDPATTYDWYVFNPTTNSYDIYELNGDRIQGNLADGGYLVVRNDGGTVTEGRAWVWNVLSGSGTAGSDDIVCEGSTYTLNGSISGSLQSYTHYNPVKRPFIIDNTTQISVSFNANHTYVSDLGFFFVDPSGENTITLAPNHGTCNSGDNVTDLTFTNQGTPTYFNYCPLSAPLTGTFNGYFDGSSNLLIDWSSLYGLDAYQGGWAVQIYDCVNQDVGSLTGATITFDDGAGNSVSYTSGSINVPIDDNSCSPETASIYEVPFTPAVSTSQTINLNPNIGDDDDTGGWQWYYSVEGASGPFVEFNNNTLTPEITINQDTWVKLVVNYGFNCTSEDTILIEASKGPSISTEEDQPQNQLANSVDPILFTVNATGPNLSYQWQVDNQLGGGYVNIDVANGSDIYTGSDSATLTLTGATNNENNYEYRVIIADGNNLCPDLVSNSARLTIDNEATISIDIPIAGDGTVNSSEDQNVAVTGNTVGVENGQMVTVTFFDGTNSIIATAMVTDGIWTVTDADISTLDNGNVTIDADVADVAGNTANDQKLVQLDNIPPSADSFSTMDTTPSLTGSGDSNETIVVELDINEDLITDVSYSVLVDSDGNWTLDTETASPVNGIFPVLTDGNKINLIAKDVAGNTGSSLITISIDTDGDGVTDALDECPNTPTGEPVDSSGCNDSQKDTDGDGVTDDLDECPNTPTGEAVDATGCSDSQKDADGDGVTDDLDECPNTPMGEPVDSSGCSDSQKDTDGDGVTDDLDECPNTPMGEPVDTNGCSDSQKDTDGDGVTDTLDECPNTPTGEPVDSSGCSDSQKDTDGEGVTDHVDQCPNTPTGEPVDTNGCSDSQKDLVSPPIEVVPLPVPAQAFTPNGDGNNDTWMIPGIENYPNNMVKVFNRWGHVVYSARGYANDWQGFYKEKNEKLPSGSYLYIIDLGNGSVPLQGWIFLNY